MLFLKIILCKMYGWNYKYATTKEIAALNATTLLSFFFGLNSLSVLFIISFLLGFSLRSIPLGLVAFLLIGIPFLTGFFLVRFFVKKDNYLKLYKQFSVENVSLFGISSKTLPYFYFGVSLLLLIVSVLLYIHSCQPNVH